MKTILLLLFAAFLPGATSQDVPATDDISYYVSFEPNGFFSDDTSNQLTWVVEYVSKGRKQTRVYAGGKIRGDETAKIKSAYTPVSGVLTLEAVTNIGPHNKATIDFTELGIGGNQIAYNNFEQNSSPNVFSILYGIPFLRIQGDTGVAIVSLWNIDHWTMSRGFSNLSPKQLPAKTKASP